MAKSSEKLTVDFKINDARVIDQKSQRQKNQDTTDKISRIMSEDSRKVDQMVSVNDMINFTEFVTQRVPSPTGSETTQHSVDCGCMCHSRKPLIETANEKIQVESRIMRMPLDDKKVTIDDGGSNSTKSGSLMEPDGETQTDKKATEPETKLMSKESAQLLKQIYKEVNLETKKVCRCFENYTHREKLQDLQNLPSCETIMNEETKLNEDSLSSAIQSPASINALSEAEVVTKVEPILVNKATSATDSACLHGCTLHCPKKCSVHCELDCSSHESSSSKSKKDKNKKEKKMPKDSFVDVDLSGSESQRDGDEKQRDRESFMKRISGSFMRRSNKS